METRCIRRHQLIASLFVLCLLVSVAPRIMAAQDGSTSIEVYQSQEFGYTIWWETSDWTLKQQSTSPGWDSMELVSDDTKLDIGAMYAPGVTPGACAAEWLSNLQATPELVRLEQIEHPGSSPDVFVGTTSDGGFATAGFTAVAVLDTKSGRDAYAVRMGCYQLGSNGDLLVVAVTRTADAFNVDNNLVPLPLRMIALPRSSWLVEPELSSRASMFAAADSGIALVRSADGTEIGMLSGHTPMACRLSGDPSDFVAYVIAEGLGFGSFVLGPDDFELGALSGASISPDAARWITPTIENTQSAVLADGETAVLELSFTKPGLVYFRPDGQAPIEIASMAGCGGGGALPVRIATD